jgi:hypothetical protein
MESAIDHLGSVSRTYQKAADDYRGIAVRAAQAEAEHRTARAKAILSIKARAERMSQGEAEARADADDRIAGLYLARLIAAAEADAHREKLRQLREQLATGRTRAASERAVDEIHARGLSGAA